MASTTVLTQAPEISLQAQENRRLQETLRSVADNTAGVLESHTRNIARGFEREIGDLRRQNFGRPELENRLQTASQTIRRKDNEIEDLNNRIHEQISQLQTLNESHSALKEQSKAHENTIEIQKWDLGELLGKERSSDAIILQWGPLIQELEAQNDDKDRELRRLRDADARNADNVNLIEALKDENSQKDLQLRRLRQVVLTESRALGNSVTESNKLRLTVQQLHNENNGLKKRAGELEEKAKEVTSLTKKVNDLNEEVEDLKVNVEHFEERKEYWKSEARHSSNKTKHKKSHSRR
ncbi:hypothetical protein N7493_004018 [Penicillium malachiteum]|uniref:Uncharacterized protein n=1 Tax=Penicillium malachiteum TaxID=1324776 RepID=A0AAD6HRB2_9EURO|nr:hypothetical protein N7493_004018 [Penicillium malachiteum]